MRPLVLSPDKLCCVLIPFTLLPLCLLCFLSRMYPCRWMPDTDFPQKKVSSTHISIHSLVWNGNRSQMTLLAHYRWELEGTSVQEPSCDMSDLVSKRPSLQKVGENSKQSPTTCWPRLTTDANRATACTRHRFDRHKYFSRWQHI